DPLPAFRLEAGALPGLHRNGLAARPSSLGRRGRERARPSRGDAGDGGGVLRVQGAALSGRAALAAGADRVRRRPRDPALSPAPPSRRACLRGRGRDPLSGSRGDPSRARSARRGVDLRRRRPVDRGRRAPRRPARERPRADPCRPAGVVERYGLIASRPARNRATRNREWTGFEQRTRVGVGMRRSAVILAVVGACAVSAAWQFTPSAVAAPFEQHAVSEQGHADAAGDADGGLAPDLTAITAFDNASGALGFRIGYANRACAGTGDSVAIYLDVDRNPSTGSPSSGFDYPLLLGGSPRRGGGA